MADLYLSADPGLTVAAQLYIGDNSIGQAVDMQAIGTTGEYFANVPSGTAAGKYLVVFFFGAIKLASGPLFWDGEKEVTVLDLPGLDAVVSANVLQINSKTLIGAGVPGDGFRPVA